MRPRVGGRHMPARSLLQRGCCARSPTVRRRTGRADTRKGDRVRFSLVNAYLPAPDEALRDLALQDEVEGVVIDFSDSGSTRRAFAVIEVVRRRTVVVPVQSLSLVGAEPPKPSQ